MARARAHIPEQPSEAPSTAAAAHGLSASALRGWLNTVIPAVTAPRAAIARVEATHPHRAEAAAMPMADRPRFPAGPEVAEDTHAIEPDRDLELLCDRLDTLTRQLARLVTRMDADRPAAAAAAGTAADDPVEAAIAEIFARQRVLAEATPDSPTMFLPPPAAPAAEPAPAAAREPSVGSRSDLGDLEQQLKLITKQLEILRSPCRAEELVAELRQELTGIAKTLDILVPRGAFDALEGEVHALAERLDSRRASSADVSSVAKLEQGLAEIRDAISNLAPVELNEAVQTLSDKIDQITGAGVDPLTLQQLDAATNSLRSIVTQVASGDALAALVNEVRELGEKIDRNPPGAPEARLAALDRDLLLALEKEVSGIAATLNAKADQVPAPAIEPLIESIVHKLDRFDLLADDPAAFAPIKAHISALGDKIDRLQPQSADAAILAPLEAQLGQLSDTIERMNAPGPDQAVLAGLDERMHAIATKLDRVEDNTSVRTDIGPLEQRIAELADKLGASEARLGNLQAIERGMAELLARLDEIRRAAGVDGQPAMPSAASFAASEPCVERAPVPLPQAYAVEPPAVEPEMQPRSSLDDFFGRAGGEARAPADREPDHPSEPQWPARSPYIEPARAAEPAGFAIPAERMEPTRHSASDPVETPADTLNLPPDAPIEPGSGPPRVRGGRSAAERIAVSQAVLGPVPADRAAGAGPRPNFIIAARRAAQAASEQHGQAAAAAGGGESGPGSVGKALAKRVKSLFVTSSVILVALGTTGVLLSFTSLLRSDGDRPLDLAAPPATALVVPQGPAARVVSVPPTPTASGAATAASPAADPTAATDKVMPAPAAAVPVKRHQERLSALASADTTGSLGLPQPAATKPQPIPAAQPAATDKGAPWADPLPPALAGKLLTAGVEARNPGAAYEIAVRYAEGRGTTADMAAAATWFARAAEGGIVPAQFRLGSMYEKGLGVRKDLAQARRFYLAAAERGNAHAMHNLAVLYAEGADGKPDFASAAKWFRQGAERGVADSQYNAAVLFARGIGVEQNLGEAYKWFDVAAKAGDKDAAKKRDEIGERLDAQTLAAARLAASVFAPAPQPEEATAVRAPAAGWDDVAVTPAKPRARARQHGAQSARL